VSQQLALKRNILDSYDKHYINTLILNYYTKIQTDNALALKQNSLIFPTTTEGSLNGWFCVDNQFTVRKIIGVSPITSYIELDVNNPSSINDIPLQR